MIVIIMCDLYVSLCHIPLVYEISSFQLCVFSISFFIVSETKHLCSYMHQREVCRSTCVCEIGVEALAQSGHSGFVWGIGVSGTSQTAYQDRRAFVCMAQSRVAQASNRTAV